MKRSTVLALSLFAGVLLLVVAVGPPPDPDGTLRVLLLGDSTTIGSECRFAQPAGPHLEDVIESRLMEERDLPRVRVINAGLDDETIQRLLGSGRYEREIATLPRVDFAVIRYGINDAVRRQDFDVNFPRDYKALLDRLRTDFPGITLLAATNVPFRTPEADDRVNRLVRAVAADEAIPLLDIYSRYRSELMADPNRLSYRRVPESAVPPAEHDVVKSLVHEGFVVVLDDRLDARFRQLPGWFSDRHPNLTGYRVIGEETAVVLAGLIRERARRGVAAAGN